MTDNPTNSVQALKEGG